ncbi:MAG: hypothetical protein JWN12_684 [Candidatus Saccharibacteria bacterium]|nr:hypothetical protein [Candidatus Saccharibacteria bacterium]
MYLTEANATPETLRVIDLATLEVKLQSQASMEVAHIVVAYAVRPDANGASRVLAQQAGPVDRARTALKELYPSYEGRREQTIIPFGRSVNAAFDRAVAIAYEEDGARSPVRSVHLLRAIIEEQDPGAERIFRAFDVNRWAVQVLLKKTPGN